MSTRAEQIAAVREVMDWLEAHPEVPLPTSIDGDLYARDYGGFSWFLNGDDQKVLLAAIARAMPGTVEKTANDASGQFTIKGRVAGILMRAVADRNQVCERIVTGTTEVTEVVPDPVLVAEVPKIEVTKVVEQVEWRCAPVLS